MRPEVKVFNLPDEKIFGRRTVREIKLTTGDLQIIKREKADNWIPAGKEFSLAFFGPKGGCKWEIHFPKEEFEAFWKKWALQSRG